MCPLCFFISFDIFLELFVGIRGRKVEVFFDRFGPEVLLYQLVWFDKSKLHLNSFKLEITFHVKMKTLCLIEFVPH